MAKRAYTQDNLNVRAASYDGADKVVGMLEADSKRHQEALERLLKDLVRNAETALRDCRDGGVVVDVSFLQSTSRIAERAGEYNATGAALGWVTGVRSTR